MVRYHRKVHTVRALRHSFARHRGASRTIGYRASGREGQPEPASAVETLAHTDELQNLAQEIQNAMETVSMDAATQEAAAAFKQQDEASWRSPRESLICSSLQEGDWPVTPFSDSDEYDDWEVLPLYSSSQDHSSEDQGVGQLADTHSYNTTVQALAEVDLTDCTGIEALDSLQSHKLKQILELQMEARELEKDMRPARLDAVEAAKRTHKRMRIIAGKAAGTFLVAPVDKRTRPMMEKVRSALFSMLLAGGADSRMFPEDLRWLDLFAGTGAIGLEALSRGCMQAHFVELDPWVIDRCLNLNIEATESTSKAVVHRCKVEEFLQRTSSAPGVGGPFDFISVTPPYMNVSYSKLFDLLAASSLLHDKSIVVVEYSKQNVCDIRTSIGTLKLAKNREYGRTRMAVYA